MKKKFTVADFQIWKAEGKKINMFAMYDYTFARLCDQSDIPLILVGDSMGMAVYGHPGTVPVTVDQIIQHSQAVVKGAPNCFIVGDMPFGSYNVSCEQAVINANRIFKEGGVDCIKLEGGVEMADKIEAIVRAGIPVMGHLGLTPQTAAALGGFKTQGKSLGAIKKLVADARAVEGAGAVATLVECVPNRVSEVMSKAVNIPLIGVGGGPACHGFGQGYLDMTCMSDMKPKFVKVYADLGSQMIAIFNQFSKDCSDGTYPAPENCYKLDFDFKDEEVL